MPRFVYLFVSLALFCGACSASSASRRVALPAGLSVGDAGSVTLVFSRKTGGVIVSVDGTLVVERATLRRLRIDNVDPGYVDLAIAADGVERQLRIWVDSGANTSVPIGAAPMPPRQSPVLTAGLSVLALLISRSVSTLLF